MMAPLMALSFSDTSSSDKREMRDNIRGIGLQAARGGYVSGYKF